MGQKLFLETAPTIMPGIFYFRNRLGVSAMVPIDDNLRNDLNTIEEFVKSEVTLPKELLPTWPTSSQSTYYRPLYQNDRMCITMGKFCRVMLLPDKFIVPYPEDDPPKRVEGEYRSRIEVTHVYMGPHQHDKLYSADLRIVNVDYTTSCGFAFM